MAFSTQDNDEVLSEINVTPLVDVMLVLLVVFIVTAPLLTNAIPINLPKTEAVAPIEQKDPVVVSIDDKGKVYINKDEIQPDLLEVSLQDAKAKNPDVRVQLQADNGVSYGEVAKLMASIEKAISGRLLHFLRGRGRLVQHRVQVHAEGTLLGQAVEVVGEVIEVRGGQFQAAQEVVVNQHRRHRDCDPDAGGNQRRTNRARHSFKARRTRRADAFQGRHDAPHRAEQADKRRGAADTGEDRQAGFQ